MTERLLDAGANPTVPCSVTIVGSEEVQNVVLTDGSSTEPLGTVSNPVNIVPTGPIQVTNDSGPLEIYGSVEVSSIVPGTGSTNLAKAEDAGHASGDVGVQILGVRNDSLATTLSSANGDYTPLAVAGTGQLYTALRVSDTLSPVRAEDDPFGAFQAVMMGGTQRQNTPTEQTGNDGDIQPLKSDSVGNLWVAATSLPLPSGAATAALQLPDGHNVTIDNSATLVLRLFYIFQLLALAKTLQKMAGV